MPLPVHTACVVKQRYINVIYVSYPLKIRYLNVTINNLFLIQLFKEFGWTETGAFASTYGMCGQAASRIYNVLKPNHVVIKEWGVFEEDHIDDFLIMDTIEHLKMHARGEYW